MIIATNSSKSTDAHKILVMLRLTNDAIYRIRQKELRKSGLTPEQAITLINIKLLGNDTTAAELARYSFRERASMAEILRRLHKNGLIIRRHDVNRKNIIKISLSVKGEKYYSKSLKIDAIESIVNLLSDTEKEQLWVLLDKIKNQALRKLKIDVKTFEDFFNKLSGLQR